jgi:hypothetical protein
MKTSAQSNDLIFATQLKSGKVSSFLRSGVTILLGIILWGTAVPCKAVPVTFPNDGTAQLVNVIRRYNDGVKTFTLGGGTPNEVFDGGHSPFQWNGITTAAGTVLQVTLDQVYPLRRFQADYLNGWHPSGGYDISVSTTGFGSLTSVASSGSSPSPIQVNTLGSAVNAKYIQYTFFGPSTGGPPQAVILGEFQAFADASAGLQTYNSAGSFNYAALQGSAPLAFTNLTPTKWQDSIPQVADRNIQTYLRGNNTGDAQFLMDLGSTQMVESIGLGFFHGQSWGAGIRIEGSLDGVTFQELYNQNTSISSTHLNTPNWAARYLRVTDKNGNSGALTEFEVYVGPLAVLDEMPLSGSTIDVGTGQAGQTLTLNNAITLTNTGELTSELLVQSFSITGLDAAIFDVPDFIPTTLTVGGIDSVMFDLTATLGAAGTYNNAVLTIRTNVGDIIYNLSASALPVPEPSTLLLLGFGAILFSARRRRTN